MNLIDNMEKTIKTGNLLRLARTKLIKEKRCLITELSHKALTCYEYDPLELILACNEIITVANKSGYDIK